MSNVIINPYIFVKPIGIENPTNTTLESSLSTFSWNLPSDNSNYQTPPGFTYTFPSTTPLGHYYLVLWNDYSSNNTDPTVSTSYRTRRVFSLHVVNSYDFSSRIATVGDVPSVSGNGNFERIASVRITNTTRSQVMADVNPGNSVDVQYHVNSETIMVVPGDEIEISVVLQGPYSEFLNWSHNAV